MAMPTVSLECVSAVMHKAASGPMEDFALDTLVKLMGEQRDLMAALSFLIDRFCGDASEDTPIPQAEWNTMVTTAIIGVVYNSIKAQIEANELTELFSEEGEIAHD